MPNEEKKPEPKSWWKRKEFWAGVGTVISTGAMLFAPEYTVVYKIGYLISAGLGAFGIYKGAGANNLQLTKENYKIGTGK